jgi:hypothetical protein
MPSLSGKTIGTGENSFVEIQFDCGASLGTLDLWGVQLEQNTTQTAFERESIQQTLAKCQRYFYKSFPLDTTPADGAAEGANGIAANYVTNAARFTYYLPVTMRVKPVTTTIYRSAAGGSNGQIAYFDGAAWQNGTASAVGDSGPQAITFQFAGTLTQFRAQLSSFHFTTSAEL